MNKESWNNNFDFLRLFAALGVLFGHCFLLTGNHANEPLYILSGWHIGELCVFVFFLISGYLVTGSYTKRPKNYVRNRFLRIFPALFINVFLTAFILGPFLTTLPIKEYLTDHLTYEYLANITFLIWDWRLPGVFESINPNHVANGSLWTLGPEVMMYGFIWILGRTGADFKKAIIPMMLIPAIMVVIAPDRTSIIMENWKMRILPDWRPALFFMIGAAYYIHRDNIKYNPRIFAILIVPAFVVSYFGFLYLGACIILPYAIFYFAFSKRIKLNNAARYGDFSYGIYIYAFLVQQALISLSGNSLLPLQLLLYSLPITLLFAALSWHLVEKNALRLKSK